MKNKLIHVAVLPARKGSVGFKGKNRILCQETFDFVEKIGIFDEVIVTTDDEVILSQAIDLNFSVINRSSNLCQNNTSIKDVMIDVIDQKKYGKNHVLWLLYLTIPYKDYRDFHAAKSKLDDGHSHTLCSFINVSSHPYDTWFIDKKNKIKKFIPNDVYRRQDKPTALEHHHYICAFTADKIQNLNSELISDNTTPIIIDNDKKNYLIEVDSEIDYQIWKEIKLINMKKVKK